MAETAQEDKTFKPKRSTNWGVIILMVILVLLSGVIAWFVFFDKKVNAPRSSLMTNIGGGSLNSMSMSNNSAYGFNGKIQ